jgi:NAD(P)-dependent dehydrogenase (short-subunit alcohol dehydrogenase family)
LAKSGYFVYAACLTDQGIEDLKSKKIKNLVPVKMNVTKQEDIDRVFEQIKNERGNLFCLINNAGIFDGCFLEMMTMEQFERNFQVNLFGAVRCCKTFVPLMREFGRGARIVNISSAASFAALPGGSHYNASKSAIKTFGDCLRLELAPFGIYVTSIMPGFFKTKIMDQKAANKRTFERAPKAIQDVYGIEFIDRYTDNADAYRPFAPDPSICVNAIVDASLARSPPMDR